MTTQIQTAGFDRFNLNSAIRRGIDAAGFTSPRPIQEQAIPAVLEGRDVLGLAQTGTGKTAAFALPILDRLSAEKGNGPRALVIAPTRELANQIEGEFRALSRFARVGIATIYGGVSFQRQIDALRRRPDVIVACPGRLLDLMNQGYVRLNNIETLVLDEADHMFDMGFLPSIRRILAALPKERQNLLFSATMPKEIRGLASEILRNPHVVELAHSAPAETIEHALYPVVESRKLALLKRLISEEGFTSAIVFTRTKHRARRMAEQLSRDGLRAVALQGNMSQSQRDRAMQSFRKGASEILVATDIAARGIDVAGVSHVINFDVPNTPEAYTHRIGRTGRAERQGKAFTFVTGDDHAGIRAIERMIGSRIPREQPSNFDGGLDDRFDRPARGDESRRTDNGQRSRSGGNGRSRRPGNGQGARNEFGSNARGPRGENRGGSRREGGGRNSRGRPGGNRGRNGDSSRKAS